MADRPERVPGVTVAIKTGCGKLYITDNTGSEYPEVFLQQGKSGNCAQSMCQYIARLISFSLRAGVPLERIIHAGKGVRCPSPTVSGGCEILSCADAISQVLEANLKERQAVTPSSES